ncbi:phage tail protein I [Sphingomonas sp.]|jgi:phage tail P2-like protein|uniref:phage tail protein I n=1 Tax=Sphingomonas sp. TaxID=28214 RepID=UPI000DBC34D7|nr:phage tail protein I [Sphingomonas sp.]PZT91663.1 MAG: phage tail protein I [Sphingomonas sp.]
MLDTPSLLPPNATAFERAVERALSRVTAIDTPVSTLMDPATIDAAVLPFLAWHLSVDRWETDWTDAAKRAAVADAIAEQRRKGTPASVDRVLADFDDLLQLVEWHETTPRGRPHTFEIRLPLGADGGPRSRAAFADAIIRDVARVKPARSQGTLVQLIPVAGRAGIQSVARVLGETRLGMTYTDDRSQPWDALLQTENGEPIQSADGTYLDTRP